MNKVVELPQAILSDIPHVLRAIADGIENNEYGKIITGIVTLECKNGVLEIFGAGAAEGHRVISLLAGSQAIMIQKIYGTGKAPDEDY